MKTNLCYTGSLFLIILTVLIFAKCASQFGARSKGNSLIDIESSPNYQDGEFVNLEKTTMMHKDASMISVGYKWIKGADNTVPEFPLKTEKFNKEKFLKLNQGIKLAWLGHSTVVLNVNGKIILTDPVFNSNPSPVGFGNKAFDYTNITKIDDLPAIDAVIISHDHYDHLDMDSIKKIMSKTKIFLVPLGVAAHLEYWGVTRSKIIELDWWQHYSVKNTHFIATPARHFSGRSLCDRNKTEWSSWVIGIDQYRIYFGGDSGYGKHFKMIGDKYGPFDLAMLECGQYNKDWPNIHMQPEETVQANLDLKGRKLLPIHWGKYKLSLHSWYEPIERVLVSGENNNVKVIAPLIGSVVDINSELLTGGRWWQNKKVKLVKSAAE